MRVGRENKVEGLSTLRLTLSMAASAWTDKMKEPSTSSNGCDLGKESERKIVEKVRCCIHTRHPNGTNVEPCYRFAFTPMTKELVDTASKKCLPLLYDSKNPNILLVCLAHRRMIMNGSKYNESQGRPLNVAQFEVGEERELQEFLDEFASYKRETSPSEFALTAQSSMHDKKLHKKIFNDQYHNLWKRYRSYDEKYAPERKRAAAEQSVGVDDFMTTRCSSSSGVADERLNIEALSTEALKRYRKYASLALRVTANSRQSLVDGVREHVEKSIAVQDQTEIAAHFLWNVRKKRNKLDHPPSGSFTLHRKNH